MMTYLRKSKWSTCGQSLWMWFQTCSCITNYFNSELYQTQVLHQPFAKWYRLVALNCKFVVSKLPASQLFNHFKHNQSLLNKNLYILPSPILIFFFWLKITLIYYITILEVTSLKIKVLTGLHSSWRLSRKSISLSFPVSRGHLHSLAHTASSIARSSSTASSWLFDPLDRLLQGLLWFRWVCQVIQDYFSSLKIRTR